MEYSEAIDNLKYMICDDCTDTQFDFIEEIELAIRAMQLQVAKKPVYSEFDDNGFDEIIPYRAECPTCGNSFEFGTWNEEENHHCDCGQKLDWSEE